MRADTPPTPDAASRDLYVAFEITPVMESDCPLNEFDGEADVIEINQQLQHGQCRTETMIQPNGSPDSSDCGKANVVHSASDVGEDCYCAVFGDFGCIPKIAGVNGDTIHIETFLSDRERLTDLVEALKAVTEELRLQQLKPIDSTNNSDASSQTVTLVLDEVTEKQREAVTKAVAAGYYSTPREASLEELADDLGISKSAYSQRLNAVESTLATRAFANTTTDM
ncbi:helix-turn-helix domain-containing protein [Halorubrum trapanicum]